MDPQNFCPKFASLFSEESLALPPEFDSFCVRHSPANEQVINEEFPGANFGAFGFFHQDLLVKTGKIGMFFQGSFFGWTWDLLTLEVWRWPLICFFCCSSTSSHALEKDGVSSFFPGSGPFFFFRMPCFFFGGLRGKKGYELDAHLEMKSRIFPESPIGTLTVIGMNT